MRLQHLLPGLLAGIIGLVLGLVGLVLDAPIAGAIAGLFALVAGVGSVRLAKMLDEQRAVQTLLEAELRVLRTDTPERPAERRPTGELRNAVSDDGAERDADQQSDGVEIVGPQGEDDHPAEDDPEALIDHTTGLFSEGFFLVALDSRIAAARRHLRPVAMVLLDVVEGLPNDEPQSIEATIVAETIKETLREADTACRLRNGYFALLLEDTPENGAIWTVERIRRQLVSMRDGLTVWAGIACYPAHAFGPDEILLAAEQALVAAREWRQDRIEVAAAAE